MKIEFLTSYYIPYIGGIENVVEHLAEGLSKRGHKVVVHTSNVSPAGHVNLKPRQKTKNYLIKRYRMYPYSLFFPKFEYSDSIISMHNYSALMNDYVAYISKGRRKIFTPYGTLTYSSEQRQHKYLAVLYDFLIGHRTIYNVDKIVGMTNYEKVRIINQFPELKNKVTVIPAGIDHIKSFSKKKIFPFKYFLSVGRISHTKKFDDVVKVMPFFPDFHYVLCGKDNGQIENIEKIARDFGVQERFHYLGEISNREKANLISNCSLFIMPSVAEAFSIASLEAFFYAKEVIAARSGGVEDLFKEMGGVTYKRADLSDLKKAINIAIKRKPQINIRRIRRNVIQKKYSWDIIVREYEKLL